MDYYKLDNKEAILVSQKAFVEKDGKVLVLKYPGKEKRIWSGKWCIPGGLLEFNEGIESGLKREIQEETNLEITCIKAYAVDGKFRYDGFIFDDGRRLNVRFIEIGYKCKPKAGEIVLSEEHTEYKWVTKKELSNLEISPDSKELVKKYLKE